MVVGSRSWYTLIIDPLIPDISVEVVGQFSLVIIPHSHISEIVIQPQRKQLFYFLLTWTRQTSQRNRPMTMVTTKFSLWMTVASVNAISSRMWHFVQILWRPTDDLTLSLLVPAGAHGFAGAPLITRGPGPAAVIARVVGHVLRTLEDALWAVADGAVEAEQLGEAEPGAAVVAADGGAVAVLRAALPGAGVAVAAGLALAGAWLVQVAGVGEGARWLVPREVLTFWDRLTLSLTHKNSLEKIGTNFSLRKAPRKMTVISVCKKRERQIATSWQKHDGRPGWKFFCDFFCLPLGHCCLLQHWHWNTRANLPHAHCMHILKHTVNVCLNRHCSHYCCYSAQRRSRFEPLKSPQKHNRTMSELPKSYCPYSIVSLLLVLF